MKTNYWQDLEPEVIYHIYNRAVGHDNLFYKESNYQFFLEKWKEYLPYLDVLAFCLMPNHFHFLVKVRPLNNALQRHLEANNTVKSRQLSFGQISYSCYLEDQFKRLFSSYALALNKQQNRTGALFQKRFKRISVQGEFKLHYLVAYIHHNPIHHRFCTRYSEWKYSSWIAYQNLGSPSAINRGEVLNWFGLDTKQAEFHFLRYHEHFRLDHRVVPEIG